MPEAAWQAGRKAASLPGGFPEGVVDPLLPSRTGLLEMIENIPIDPQRDEFFGVRNGRPRRGPVRRLGCCLSEGGFSGIPYAGSPASAVVRHAKLSISGACLHDCARAIHAGRSKAQAVTL
jgi:hypothetical protein